MRMQYLKQSAVTELRRAVGSNHEKYSASDPWLVDFFQGREFLADSRIELETLPILRPPGANGELYELDNSLALHRALKDLTPSQAADERLWVWLAHGPYWDYMRLRWPAGRARSADRYVLEHYFLADARSLVRHGVARLWWFGYATVQWDKDDPYCLTRLLLNTTDARQSIMERQFWRNRRVLTAMLERIYFWRDSLDFFNPRDRFRRLCKTLNLCGGTMLLDALSATQVHEIVDQVAAVELTEQAPA